MSALDPQGPSQPSANQAHETAGNPAEKQPAEEQAADTNAHSNAAKTDRRVPQEQSTDQSQATDSSLARGIHGAPPGEEARGETHESIGPNNELDGEQMRAAGEGDVRDAVASKPGAGGTQGDFVSDLDRKKAEQAPAREAIQEKRKQAVDVGGALGQRGGPANPVDKGNYPNSGD